MDKLESHQFTVRTNAKEVHSKRDEECKCRQKQKFEKLLEGRISIEREYSQKHIPHVERLRYVKTIHIGNLLRADVSY